MKKIYSPNRLIGLAYYFFFISTLSMIWPSNTKQKSNPTPSVMNGNSIVQIKTTVLYPSFILPWKYKNPETRYSSGIYVGNGQILVPAQAIYFYTNIEIKKFGSLQTYQAKMLRMDPDLGLALLKIDDPIFDKNLIPVHFPDELSFPGKGIVVENEEYRNLQEKSLRLIRMDVDFYSNGYIDLPFIEIKSEERLDGIGELIIDEITRVPQGILYQFKTDQNTGKMIPNFMIRQFLSNEELPFKGFRYRPLTDKTTREFYGLKKDDLGILIAEVVCKSSADGVLLLEDVLLEVDGYKIDPKGFFEHPKFGKLPVSFLFHSVQAKKSLRLKILREKKEKIIQFPLKPIDSESIRIPFGNTRFEKPKYLILGGMVFIELSETYLMEYGNQWRTRVGKELLYLNDFHKFATNKSERKFVVISQVLPIAANKTYHGFQQVLVQDFNGTTIDSLEHLKNLYEKNKDEFIKIDTKEGTEIFFFTNQMKDLDAEIQKTFGNIKLSNL
ncbi:MAG: serine protease [Leptospira sp.]|nr:serine protease [Leptospira sp.]